MTLEEMKIKVYALIEEYNEEAENLTEDEDLASKFNSVANQVINEVARMKKIEAYTTIEGQEGDIVEFKDIDDRLYQVNIVRGVECDLIGSRLKFNSTGTAEIFYYQYPIQIDIDTDDSTELDLSIDALECVVYGIAADLLAADVSTGYGQVYRERYRQLLQELDPRKSLGSVYISGGIDVL